MFSFFINALTCGRNRFHLLKLCLWCVYEQEVELQTRQIPLPSVTETILHFKGTSLQVQGTFCYVNETNLFVFVDVFKCQLVDMSVVLNTSNEAPEHQSPAFGVLL